MKQTTDKLFMIRPDCFYKNEQTAINNYFQKRTNNNKQSTTIRAQKEFDDFVDVLKVNGVKVYVWQDAKEPITPDAIFPNNWISFHNPSTLVSYPMFAPNRQLEVNDAPIEFLASNGFSFNNKIDFTPHISSNRFLEGTGSMVLDRVNKIAYCARSERTNEELINLFCKEMGYTSFVFSSFQTVNGQRKPIYHTNVMMSIGLDFAMVCLQSVDDPDDRNTLIDYLNKTGKRILELNEDQIQQFAGNALELKSDNAERLLALSSRGYHALTSTQIEELSDQLKIIHSPLSTIELLGGGSARCMMAEIFM